MVAPRIWPSEILSEMINILMETLMGIMVTGTARGHRSWTLELFCPLHADKKEEQDRFYSVLLFFDTLFFIEFNGQAIWVFEESEFLISNRIYSDSLYIYLVSFKVDNRFFHIVHFKGDMT